MSMLPAEIEVPVIMRPVRYVGIEQGGDSGAWIYDSMECIDVSARLTRQRQG